MIKYPVKVIKVPHFLGGFRFDVVEADTSVCLAICYTEETANSIANALSAMNEFTSIFKKSGYMRRPELLEKLWQAFLNHLPTE